MCDISCETCIGDGDTNCQTCPSSSANNKICENVPDAIPVEGKCVEECESNCIYGSTRGSFYDETEKKCKRTS